MSMGKFDFIILIFKVARANLFKATVFFLFFKLLEKLRSWIATPLNLLPGPRSKSFLWGVYPSIREEPFMEPHKRWWKEAGVDAKLLHYTTFFGRSSLVVLDKDIVREILTAQAGKKPRYHKKLSIARNILGDGLVTLEGQEWMRHRRIIQPSFLSSTLKQTLDDLVPSKANLLVEYWKKAIGREIDVASHLSAVTLDVIGYAAFSHSFNAMEGIKDWVEDEGSDQLAELKDPFISAMLEALKPDLFAVILDVFALSFLNNYVNPRGRKSARITSEAVHQVIQNARANGPDNPKSLLQLLLNAEDPDGIGETKLTLSDLVNETKTFLVAGHETTATLCYWALFALSKYPDIQDKVLLDIEEYRAKGSENITAEMLDEMEYFHAFVLEVLRLYPPVGMILRTNYNTEVLGGQSVPEGTRLVIPIHLLHRHPHYWDEPELFNPERWATIDDDRVRFAFIPFSGGGRNCIGQRFALIEAKLILAPLVCNFRFQVAPSQRDTEFTFSNFITMKSKPPFKIVAQCRKE